jgi:hypothetical protein
MRAGHLEIRVWSGDLQPEVVVAAIYMAVSLAARVSDDTPIATTGKRLTEPKHAMCQFIRQFVINDSMIVDDLDPADLFAVMMTQAEAAKQVVNR